ncbi:hypothetical protein KP509_12G039100 [Ceratopteris richardii]|uniref:Radical SAM core domain-containing protein n=1 Tax=Ceratopteris richardii TaxID=49495 RepID=A0A8T2TNT5_CERRI|nr:hypothetical protein KP509_12G039100 [Ceratopteris richardii]
MIRERRFSIFDEVMLRNELDAIHVNPCHIDSTWRFVLDHKDAEAYEVPNLPLKAQALFRAKFKPTTSHVHIQYDSSDGRTTKLLVMFESGLSAEAVIMRHDSSAGKYAGGPRTGAARATLCVSSQVGCKMGCTFCATGTMGFKGNLSAAEILEQLVHASRITPIRNVVFMGMGEPMNNYSAVVRAAKSMTGRCFHLSPKHITISTVGIIPRIISLKADFPEVSLAISLHAPTQELRSEIVPAARAFPLSKLIAAVDDYLTESKSKVFIEYVMLAMVNDTEVHAHQLGQLLRGKRVVINLIPYNPTSVVQQFKASGSIELFRFQKILKEVYNLRTTVRQEMGQDIEGACGQLHVSHRRSNGSAELDSLLQDIEELGIHR